MDLLYWLRVLVFLFYRRSCTFWNRNEMDSVEADAAEAAVESAQKMLQLRLLQPKLLSIVQLFRF